jgi:hypothetical protein
MRQRTLWPRSGGRVMDGAHDVIFGARFPVLMLL